MKAKNIKELKPIFNSKFFIDTNVWLYLYFPQYSNVAQTVIEAYSNMYNEILEKECLVVTDMIQMSEVINLTIQLEYKSYCRKNSPISFKDFRGSAKCSTALENAKIFANKIIKTTTLKGGIFTPDELISIVQDCEKADFNDIYFAQFCYKESSILITHDFDFNALEKSIPIYTANKNYLT